MNMLEVDITGLLYWSEAIMSNVLTAPAVARVRPGPFTLNLVEHTAAGSTVNVKGETAVL